MSNGVTAHNRRYEKNKKSVDCLKYSLFIFNFVFMVSGFVVLGIGIWTLVSDYYYFITLASSSFGSTATLLIVAGLFVIINSIFGCIAIIKEDRCYLLIYTFLLLLIFLLELIAAVLAYVYGEQLRTHLDITLRETFNDNYGKEEEITMAIDALQSEYKCCGSFVYSDWQYSDWRTKHQNMSVPDTCCQTISFGCGERNHPSNIWYTGCIHRIESELRPHLHLLGGITIIICVLQIIGLILSCRLYVKLKTVDDY